MSVTLRVADVSEKPAYWEMLAAYLVEHAVATDLEGKHDPLDFPNFDKYWIEEKRTPFWIMDGEDRAGIALVSRFTWSGEPTDHALIEYYVAPQKRRSKIGLRAARQLFLSRPGQWELACAHLTPGSQAFWIAAIAATPHRMWRTIDRDEDVLHRFVVE